MACEIVESAGALYALWGKPTKVDFARLLERLRAAVDRHGGPIVYVTRVPDGAPPPDPQVRRYLNELMPAIVECCSSYHVVMEGAGFMAALKRGVLVSLFQITQRRGTFFVHANFDEVLQAVSVDRVATVRALLDRAGSQGLLAGNPLASMAPARKPEYRVTG